MGTENSPVCPRHPGDVRMKLQTLHSDRSAPERLLGVYACPDCDHERRLPIDVRRCDGRARDVFPPRGG